MSTCQGCGGVVGQDCWNPQECEWISHDMAARHAAQPEVESPRNAFREALAEHLTSEYARYNYDAPPILGSDIDSVRVEWDEGETCDSEDYGLSPRLPALTVEVALSDRRWVKADPGFVIGQLIEAML